MIVGFNRSGVRSCARKAGCLYPEPKLSSLEAIAWQIFDQVSDCWETRGGELSSPSLGFFRMDQARLVADGYNVEWEGYLQDLVRLCARTYREEFVKKQKAAAKKAADAKRRQEVRQAQHGRRHS